MPTITANIANRGAPTTTGPSATGHMWISIDNGKGQVNNYGFGPATHGSGFTDGQVSTNDDQTYLRKDYQETFTISDQQYNDYKNWADNTVRNGWGADYIGGDNGDYVGGWNDCINYAYESLFQSGVLNDNSYDGFFWPSKNDSRLRDLMYDYYRRKEFNRELNRKKIQDPHDKWWDAWDYRLRRSSPIVLDLNADGITGNTDVRQQHVRFDFDGKNNIIEGAAWVDANDGFLVIDKNNNGKIDTGLELFGDNTVLSNGQTAKDGIEAMQDLDKNKDGKLNAQDAAFSQLKIWRDANQNGITDAGELKTLAAWGITEFNIKRGTHYTENRNQIDPAGTFTIDGKEQKMADVWFARDPFYNKFTDTLPVNDTAKQLPNIEGMGAELSK